MIDIKNITKSFGSLQVLKGIDLHIDKSEVVSIVGPSGAGKTTLLQIIGTLDRPDTGSVVVDGIDTTSLSAKHLADFRNRHLPIFFSPSFELRKQVCYIIKQIKTKKTGMNQTNSKFFLRTFAKNTAHNERRLLNFSYICTVAENPSQT